MKKFFAVTAAIALAAFAAPALAATNPFMDVPINHWSYDAIGQLAAHGILAGYPDGTYKGKQPTTRYEMASAIARTLGYIDLNKASRQDTEMLKKLVVEFKDELDALGVKVNGFDERISALEKSEVGWKISGVLRLETEDYDGTSATGADRDAWDGRTRLSRARLIFERWFGENQSMKFYGRFNVNATTWEQFNVDMPFIWDSRLTVGRFIWEFEDEYYLGGSSTPFSVAGFGYDDYLTDRYMDGFGVTKALGLGNVRAYVTRTVAPGTTRPTFEGVRFSAWEFGAKAQLQFTERFGFDVGGTYFLGDDISELSTTENLNSLLTGFAGLRVNFGNAIALKGIYFYQKMDAETKTGIDLDMDSASAYKGILEVNQDLLKFTGLWLEYFYMERNFARPTGENEFFTQSFGSSDARNVNMQRWDTTIYRISATQRWNPKWGTMLHYAHYAWDVASDPSANEWAVGVRYWYRPGMSFQLGYSKISYDDAAVALSSPKDASTIRLRTEIFF